ncbi:Nrap protein [Lentinula aciculospora]|uniref:U3 small nucleolar RNA-associated protein 22 n=1 Tax=Lentinula aciculospora TaxID=153920 RepID=A0A9W9A603_9AGAR|nr:Nrap protein [Lentinula aciculospora]
MTAELKRKRAEGSSSRKLQKLSPPVEDEDTSAQETDGDAQEEQDDGEDVEMDNGEEEELEGEWEGVAHLRSSGEKSSKPTGEEIRVIKDASDLFRSNTFKLQIEALLPNVQPKSKRKPPLERFLLSFHTFLSCLPDVPQEHPLEASRRLLKKGVSVPYPTPPPTEDTQWKVAFSGPTDITLVGSWANETSVKAQGESSYGVDLAVEMPSSLFQEKDYLNGRFFHKKAFYLATIAAAISNPKSGFNVDVSYISTNDDPRLTKLVLKPRADGSPNDFTKLNAQIHIIPTLSSTDSPIPLHRLSPAHANIRITPESYSSLNTNLDNAEDPSKLPSPLYNTALLTSLIPKSYLLSVHAIQQSVPAFSDALALLRVWANQRGYGESGEKGVSVRGFDGKGPWWAALLMYLVQGEEPTSAGKKLGRQGNRKPLGKGLSSYQLFRAVLDFLAKHDFENKPVFVKTEGGHRYSPNEYLSTHDIVFVDSSSAVNLLAGVPLGSMKLLNADARKTLETINSSSTSSGDPFPEVFLRDHRNLHARFDIVIYVDLSTAKPRKPDSHHTLDSGSASNAVLASISSVLTQALGNRVRTIAILHPTPRTRPLSQAHPTTSHIVHIGLFYNPVYAWRQVDHGPNSASDPDPVAVEKFRDLWGDKAELRRFKDGSIVESVVWDVKTVDEKTLIPKRIVAFVLNRHFGIGEEGVRGWQEGFDGILRLPEGVSRYYVGENGLGVAAVGFKAALRAFDGVVKAIKALSSDEGKDALPLSVMNISPTSESLRFTSVFSPVPLPHSIASVLPPNAKYTSPMEFVIEFERSSRWPDNLRAVQKVKMAFLEKIARGLMERVKGLRAAVIVGDVTGVDEGGMEDVVRLEVIIEEGWAFIGRIWHDREAVLLDRIINDSTSRLPHVTRKDKFQSQRQGKDYHTAIQAREAYTRLYTHAPMHHRVIAKLFHQYPAFAGTVRIAKRWFASHWLLGAAGDSVSEEAVELLCAMLFVKQEWEAEADKDKNEDQDKQEERLMVPGSKERGFASLIQFLKDWKWDEQGDGIFIPLYGSSIASVSKQPKAVATLLGTGVWKIRTAMDEEGVVWTMFGPDAVVARRVKALAQATWQCLKGMEMNEVSERGGVLSMFDHPTDNYDVIIKLDRSLLPRYHQNVSLDQKQLSWRQKSDKGELAAALDEKIRPGFDPARLLFMDLKRVYQDTFRIFHDTFGGDQFGIVWDPSLKQPRPFRVLGGFSFCAHETNPTESQGKKSKDKKLVFLNEQGVLGEIERLGRGVVSGITLNVEIDNMCIN